MMKDFEHDRKTLRPTGDPVKVVAENGRTPIRASSETNPFEKYKGVLKRFRSRKKSTPGSAKCVTTRSTPIENGSEHKFSIL
jgi:hypothetical protein